MSDAMENAECRMQNAEEPGTSPAILFPLSISGQVEAGRPAPGGLPLVEAAAGVMVPLGLHPAAGDSANEEGRRKNAERGTVENLVSGFKGDRERGWRGLWEAWQRLKEERPGIGRREAAALLGVGQVTLWRIEREYVVRGFECRVDNCGRDSQWEYLLKSEGRKPKAEGNPKSEIRSSKDGLSPFAAKLREIYLATIGASGGNVTGQRRTAKMATALVAMAEEAECPKELASRLRAGKFPVCLQRFLKRVTPELEERLRGPKHFALNGLTSRRDLTVRFEDGTRGELPAGFKWVFDDMSANQPFWAECRMQNEECRMLFSRQGLYCIDHRSLRWLGKELIARPREAYRSEDILRFCRRLFQIYGVPDMIVFERGVWHSRKIRGFRVTNTQAVVEEEAVRPEMAEADKENLSRGLASIGVKVLFATSAHGKIIEGGFNHLQDILAIKTRDFVNIGRHAGEFELGARRMRQARGMQKAEGRMQTGGLGQLGFAPMGELSDRIDQAFAHINGKTNSRGEVPDEIWVRDVGNGTDGVAGRRPLRRLQGNDYAVFLPEIRERSVRGGQVSVDVDGVAHDFRGEWMAEMGSGFKVWMRFDPSEPTLGAAFYCREAGPANIHGWKLGRFIGWGAWEMPGPSADVVGDVRGIERRTVEEIYGAGAFDNRDNLRRKQSKLVATSFSALPRPGQPAIKSSEARDGMGRVTKIETGAGGKSEDRNPKPEGSPKPEIRRGMFAAPSSEDLVRRREDLSRQAARANALRVLQEA
jgi:hypothetical protein